MTKVLARSLGAFLLLILSILKNGHVPVPVNPLIMMIVNDVTNDLLLKIME
jgi:hypothetical protein